MCEILKFYECENNGFSNTVVLRKIKLSHILVNTATDRALFSGEGAIVVRCYGPYNGWIVQNTLLI